MTEQGKRMEEKTTLYISSAFEGFLVWIDILKSKPIEN